MQGLGKNSIWQPRSDPLAKKVEVYIFSVNNGWKRSKGATVVEAV